jgi:hypothetical protein
MSKTGPKPVRKTTKKAAKKTRKKATAVPKDLGIEEAWRYIDRFCRALWVEHMHTDPPGSLAEAITAMRDQGLVPAHEAGMMHNIRAMRNMLVHEDVVFGEHETTIARAAWQIVRAWAVECEPEAWHLVSSMCDRRAA